jgi:hypothetical protein
VATFHAFAATGHAILRLLEDACPRSVFPQSRFDFLPVDETVKPISEGITLHLYRVAANAARRFTPVPPLPNEKRFHPMINLDLYYLISAWASNADMQQRLLGWAMRTLADTPVLPPGLLNAFGPEAETFHPGETVELIFEPLSLADMGVLWEQVRPKPGLSAAYVARMVALESTVSIMEGREVQTRAFDLAKGPDA